jgi:uncharacterized protein YecE (DUF72 family)
MTELRVGTSTFVADGWENGFYPPGMRSIDYLSFYAKQFDTVELNYTFNQIPEPTTVKRWYRSTPPQFIFAAKIPRTITHEKVLVDCDGDLQEFLKAMEPLADKLGPLLFAFSRFDERKFRNGTEFLNLLKPFLRKLPRDHKFAVEIKNRNWLDGSFVEVLRQHNVALALIDHVNVPRPWEMRKPADLITADFLYVRWVGDLDSIEVQTKTWNKVVIDRRKDLTNWIEFIRRYIRPNSYAYANNSYSGYAPGTVKLFWDLAKEKRIDFRHQ